MLTSPLKVWQQRVDICTACTISRYCRSKVGIRTSWPKIDIKTDLLFVGEAPGQSEYALRTPFVGPAGQELSDIIAQSLHHSIHYTITNAVMCTPFSDESRSNIRTPSVPEIAACRTHLSNLIEIIKPRHIVALGKVAERSLKKFIPQGNYCPTYSAQQVAFTSIAHPSAILRSTHPELDRTRAMLTLRAISDALCEHRQD